MSLTKEQKQDIERCIRLTWESLESHLQWTYEKTEEGTKFHADAIRDYAEIITRLSKLL